MEAIRFEGFVCLNGVNISYIITNDAFNAKNTFMVGHVVFESTSKNKPNLLSETGYKSHFFGKMTEEFQEVLMNNHEDIVMEILYLYLEDKGKYNLKMGMGMEKEEYIQQLLF